VNQFSINAANPSLYDALTWKMQAVTQIVEANPVSAAFTTVLATTANVRLIGLSWKITWAVTQPTPGRIKVTIDGNVMDWYINNPVSNTTYYLDVHEGYPANADLSTAHPSKAFQLEGRSVKIEMSVIWAVTQPTNMTANLYFAKR
jgi:hypothetical protein